MLLQSDYKIPPFLPRYRRRSLSELRKKFKIKKTKLEKNLFANHDKDDDNEEFFLVKYLLTFSENTTVHGVKYIGQDLHWFERIIWMCLVTLAIIGIVVISLQLSNKFNSSPLSTVVESTIFPVSEIPYPSITICPNNRFHAQRSMEAEDKFLPNASIEVITTFRFLLLGMNSFEFGALDEFERETFEITSSELDQLNLTEIFEFAMLTCEEIFTGKCWWRNKYYNCCDDFFHLQKSEYGLCFSFNSAVNEIGIEKDENTSVHYPYRTSNYGDWSGLRVEMSSRSDIALLEELNGIKMQVQHPMQWPNSANFIPSGSSTSIAIKPTFSYTTSDVRSLPPSDRQCLNKDESKSAMTLPGLQYLQMNCISECRQQHLYKYCQCSIASFYPIGNFTDCNFEDLKCLLEYNDIFNYEKPPSDNPYFSDDDLGMTCPCLPECHRVEYSIEITTNIIFASQADADRRDNLTLDFHYQSANLVKYRTDITFGWLDLMVSFGGIAGLFLGCSILSAVEIIYYLILIFMVLAKRVKLRLDKKIRKHTKILEKRKFRDNLQVVKVISLTNIDKCKIKSRF